MKTLQTFLMLAIFTATYAQDNWVDLKIPQTKLLGRPIIHLTNGDVDFQGLWTKTDLTYDINDGPDYTSEYLEKFRKTILPAFNKTKFTISDVTINKTKVKSLAAENFFNGNLTPRTAFAYEGLTADSMSITFKYSKNLSIKPAEIIDIFKKYIPGGVWTDIASAVSKADIGNKDSIERVIRISNPDVFFRVKFIKYKENTTRGGKDWETYSIRFNDMSKPLNGNFATSKLTIDDEDLSRTHGYYPEFSGRQADVKSRKYFFKLVGDENNLKLLFVLDDPLNTDNPDGYKIIREITPKTIGGVKQYTFGYKSVDKFLNGDILKFVRMSAKGRQINPTTIQLDNSSTYMKYPGVQIEYITKL